MKELYGGFLIFKYKLKKYYLKKILQYKIINNVYI